MWSEVVAEDECVDTINDDKSGEHVDYCPDDENGDEDESLKQLRV